MKKRLGEQEKDAHSLIACAIHDGAHQLLTGAQVFFQAFKHDHAFNPQGRWTTLDAGLELLGDASPELRHFINGLRPPGIQECGIVASLKGLISATQKRGGPQILLSHDLACTPRPPWLETTLYRIAQESLTNACRHSKSTEVHIALIDSKQSFHFEVRDQGVGFAPDTVSADRFGLGGIWQRASMLGAGRRLTGNWGRERASASIGLPH